MSLASYAVSSLLLAFVVSTFVRAFVSPFRNVPAAHWSCRFSGLFILFKRFQRCENATLLAAHRRHGDRVLLSPVELSINDPSGLRAVYVGGWEKPSWYLIFRNVAGTPNLFTFLDSKSHATRKRVISSVYAKSNLLSSHSPVHALMTEVVLQDMLRHIEDHAQKGDGVQICNLFARMGMDGLTGFIFGRDGGSRYLDDKPGWKIMRDHFGDSARGVFLAQELPTVDRLIRFMTWGHDPGLSYIDEWFLRRCETAEVRDRLGKIPDGEAEVWKSLQKGVECQAGGGGEAERRKLVASEVIDHALAGFDTTSIALTYCVYQLSLVQNAGICESLRKEVLSLDRSTQHAHTRSLPSLKSIDALPLLSAVVMETLRLHQPVPGAQPRISPKGAMLNGLGPLPGGLRVSANALSLHRKESVFPEPDRWIPDRWIRKNDSDDERLKEMHRWFWAFGSGGRMCVGSHFALLEIKIALVAVYANFNTVIEDDSGIEQLDGFTAGPHKDLVAKFIAV
ncbi:cytochrome P450 [Xylariales sp. AK1849]|nr:cytochrome P450 [Xylariales sp. AK1849]